MPTISINQFDGGIAEDIRTFAINKCEKSLNFDIYTNQHLLIPIRDSVNETVYQDTIVNIKPCDVGISKFTPFGGSSQYNIVATGNHDDSSKVTFYNRNLGATLGGITPNGEWIVVNTTAQTGTFQRGTSITYKDLRYAMSSDGALHRLNDDRTSEIVGTASGTGSNPRPFIHPDDNILYIVWGTVISTWDGTTFTNTPTILPTDYLCNSMTNYGGYLAIAMRPSNGNGRSSMYLWGRDTSINTLQSVIDLGEGTVSAIENINDTIIILSYHSNELNSTMRTDLVLDIKKYEGGSAENIKSIPFNANGNKILKVKKGNKLYFVASDTDLVDQTLNNNILYSTYKNKAGQWVVAGDRYIYNSSTATDDKITDVLGLDVVGDYFYVLCIDKADNYRLRAMDDGAVFGSASTNTSIYKTTINPSMPIADRYREKKLESVQISYTASGITGATTNLKYSIDGASFTSIISEVDGTGDDEREVVFEATNQADGSPFLSGREFQFQIESIKGNKIKDIKYKYTILNTTI